MNFFFLDFTKLNANTCRFTYYGIKRKIMDDFFKDKESRKTGNCKERIVWNNLRARHYAVLILLAIVALETSAIAIDKLINREGDTAFAIESPFQNNLFIQSFKVAEASCKKVPANIEAPEVSTQNTPAPAVNVAKVAVKEVDTKKEKKAPVEKYVAAKFVAATSKEASEKVYIEYSVQPGDSLSHIAKLFDSDTKSLKTANHIADKHVIKVGQTIKVPLPASEMTYSVKPGDSLSKIASRFRIPLKNLIAHNSLKSHRLQAEQKIRIPVKKSAKDLRLINNARTIKTANKRLAMIKNDKPALIPSEPKLKKIDLQRVQIAKAPASKPDIKFLEKELMVAPPKIRATQSTSSKPAAKEEAVIESVQVKVKPETKAVAAEKESAKQTVANEETKKEHFVYEVKKGDNLLRISHRHNTTVAQIKSENGLKSNLLRVGDKLKISPGKKLYRVVKNSAKDNKVTMVSYKVKKGDCLSLIARRHGSSISSIITENNLSSSILKVGQKLKIPADKKKYKVIQQRSKARKTMTMPVHGRLSSRYGWRKHPIYRKKLFHAGIDLAAPKGTPIKAAKGGKVIYAGRRSGYGKLVIISHSSGYSTRYGHCSSILVRKGQYVKAGQLIARVGATGIATGNHLHFEIRKNGKTVNPQTYLK
jgi:murein DD-endopeptidase MepM/ murein hydrolase activator NlpD